MAEKLSIMRLQLDSQSKSRLDKLCDKRGMTQIAVMSRMVTWFLKQNEIIQALVVGAVSPSALTPTAKRLLEHRNSESRFGK
jgi:hypothetical protein